MRWEDERYVRIFTRDTAEILALGWEARSLLWEILRKVDRAGILALGKTGLRGLAALTTFPLEVVERALPVLLEDGCVQRVEGALVVPNFILAQDTPQSDKLRQKEKRERDRLRAMAGGETHTESQNVSAPSRDVTQSHALSRGVTDGHAVSLRAVPPVPCRAVPDRTDPDPPVVPRGGTHPEPQVILFGEGGPPAAEKTPDEKPGKGAKRARAKTEMPAGWSPPESVYATGIGVGLDRAAVDRELLRFRDHHGAKGSRFADWGLAAHTWIRNVPDFQRGRGSAAGSSTNNVQPVPAGGRTWIVPEGA